jgi:hypothetical protein
MAHITADRVKETTTTTGAGALTLAGAASGFRAFSSVMAAADTCFYAIVGGTEWEVGLGTYNTTLARTTILSSSNAGAVVTLSAGTKDVFITPPAAFLAEFEPSGALPFPAVSSDPAAPAAGTLLQYSKSVANRILPKIIGPSGIDTIMQVGLHGNSVVMVAPASGTTAPTIWGGTLTTAATMSLQQTVASSSPWLATSRKRFQTAATAGSTTGCRLAYTQWFRGSATGYGGFWHRVQFGQNLNITGSQAFVGLCASTAILNTAAGSAGNLINCIGMGYDTTDANTGNWYLMRNDGSGTCTKVDLGSNAARSNTTHGYDLIIYCPPGAATDIYVRVVNLHSGVTVLDTSYNTDIPATNTGMAWKCEVNNGAVASATNIEMAKLYIESDY